MMIDTLVAVARRFQVIRIDAAMTLVRQHIQRLWYPSPGEGGAIPSRAEHGLSGAEFERRMPQEFWRQVVDRVAAEAPDTLLLAEGFWLIESGSVAVGQFLPDGDFRGVALLGPGDSWGELAMFADRPRVVDAVARSACKLRHIRAPQFEAALSLEAAAKDAFAFGRSRRAGRCRTRGRGALRARGRASRCSVRIRRRPHRHRRRRSPHRR